MSRFGRRFAAGDVIFQDGDSAKEAFLLQEGRVRLIKRVGAVERSLRMLRPGDLFGESALAGAPRSSTAVAMSDGVALALDQATFQQIMASHPEVGGRVLHQLIRRLRDAEDQIEVLMLRDAQLKVVVAILKLAQQAQAAAGPEADVVLTVSPMELSTRVGLDVDTVKRNVKLLREAEYLRIADEKVVVSDLAALKELYSLLIVKDQIVGGDVRERAPRARTES